MSKEFHKILTGRLVKYLYVVLGVLVVFMLARCGMGLCTSGWGCGTSVPTVSGAWSTPNADGTVTVTITGSGFIEGSTVTINSVACTSVHLLSSTALTCILPNGQIQLVNIIVTAPGGASSGAAATYQDVVLADSPMVYWRLGESSGTSAQDASGNGHTATYISGVTLGVPGALSGNANTAASFNGTTQYVDAGSIAALNLEYTHAFTLESWIKTSNTATNKFILAHDRSDGAGDPGYYMVVCEQAIFCPIQNVLSLYVASDGTHYIHVQGSTTVNDGSWHHVVATYSGNGLASGIKFYVDGHLETAHTANDTLSSFSIVSSAPVTIGSREFGEGHFAGSIDEAAIYGAVLSAARVSAHYSVGSGH